MDGIVVEDSIEKIWSTLFERVRDTGNDTGKTYDLLNQHFVLTNMEDNIMFFPGQNIYLPFLITDFHDLLTSKNPGWALKWHRPSRKFCGENGRFLGHYGERIRQNQGDQLLWCYKELQQSPDSRRAILTYYYPKLDQYQPYPPCTLSQQFMIRDGKLHTFVLMRSNDLMSGALYDWTHRALLGLHMAAWLNVEPGNYYHTSQSLHLYKSMKDKIDAINLKDKLSNNMRDIPKVGPVSYEGTENDILHFELILSNLENGTFSIMYPFKSKLWEIWAKIMAIFSMAKNQYYEGATTLLAEIEEAIYFDIVALYLLRSIKKNYGTIKDYSFIQNDIRFSDNFIEEFIYW